MVRAIKGVSHHEESHALLLTDRGEYARAPAFDGLPGGRVLGYPQMRVGATSAQACPGPLSPAQPRARKRWMAAAPNSWMWAAIKAPAVRAWPSAMALTMASCSFSDCSTRSPWMCGSALAR
jgi:hypothetical protein